MPKDAVRSRAIPFAAGGRRTCRGIGVSACRGNGAKVKVFGIAGGYGGRWSGRDASPFAAGGQAGRVTRRGGQGTAILPDRADPTLTHFGTDV